MELWGTVIFILACAAAAIALGVQVAFAAATGFLASFFWVASKLGGLQSESSFAMMVAFFSVPVAVGTAIAVAIGLAIRHLLGGRSAVQAIGRELKAPPVAGSYEEAADTAARHFRTGSRIRISCPNCLATLTAQRVLSATSQVPDIEVNCRCGLCRRILPFRGSAA